MSDRKNAIPGNTVTCKKTKYFAVATKESSLRCNECAHYGDNANVDTPTCQVINKRFKCNHIIWLTEPDFILHRLTS